MTWDFGDGTTAAGASVCKALADSGSTTVTVRATDAAGNVASDQRAVTVTAPGPRPATGTPAPAADTTKPVVSAFRSTRARFRVGSRSTATVAQRRAAAGTVLRAPVSEHSTLAVEVVQGRRVVAIDGAGNRSAPRAALLRIVRR